MYLTQALHRLHRQSPDAVFTRCGERIRTVGESVDRIARLAASLQQLGLEKGERVGILGGNSDVFHESVLATWWAGGAVNPVNARWSPAEIAYSLVDCDTRFLIVDDGFLALVPRLRKEAACLTTVIHAGADQTPAETLSFEELIAGHAPIPDSHAHGGDLAGIFYTGGTTGRPKGVMLSHANISVSVMGLQATSPNVVAGGHALVVAPMFHLAGLGAWNSQLVAGGSFTFLDGFDPAAALDAIERDQVTSILVVPTMIQMLVDEHRRRPRDLSSVRRVQYGGSPISQSLLARAREAFTQAGFAQGYGMTEAAPGISTLGPEDHERGLKLTSAGRPARHVEVKIVDPVGEEVPRGEVGEIAVRGANVMLGYWQRPADTAAALRDGWLHTGDAGRMDDEGYIYVVDRIKDMIITGGENVYSAEVEHALLQHPAVHQVAVIAVPDEQ